MLMRKGKWKCLPGWGLDTCMIKLDYLSLSSYRLIVCCWFHHKNWGSTESRQTRTKPSLSTSYQNKFDCCEKRRTEMMGQSEESSHFTFSSLDFGGLLTSMGTWTKCSFNSLEEMYSTVASSPPGPPLWSSLTNTLPIHRTPWESFFSWFDSN